MFCNHYKVKYSSIIDDCNFSVSCKCKECLRQPPSLRGVAKQTVFHFIYSIKQFKLTSDIKYDHYVYAVFSQTVHVEKLIPDTHPILQCVFSKEKNKRDIRFHANCVIRTRRAPAMWSTWRYRKCWSKEETITYLLTERKELWSWHCERPLFILPSCRSMHRT